MGGLHKPWAWAPALRSHHAVCMIERRSCWWLGKEAGAVARQCTLLVRAGYIRAQGHTPTVHQAKGIAHSCRHALRWTSLAMIAACDKTVPLTTETKEVSCMPGAMHGIAQ